MLEVVVCRLQIFNPEDLWNLSCMLMVDRRMSMVTLMDLGPSFPEFMLCNKLLKGKDFTTAGMANGLHLPTADELYTCLLEGMAGANNEMACITGPPRRPAEIVVSFRLQPAFAELKQKMKHTGVKMTLESEVSLQKACAQQGTAMATGYQTSEIEELRREAAFAGTLVKLQHMADESLNEQAGLVVSPSAAVSHD